MKRSMLALAIMAAACATFVAVPARAQDSQVYAHNGSTMILTIRASAIQITYLFPRAGLPVESGAPLFNGIVYGDQVIGFARVFSRRCGATTYEVSGAFTPDGSVLTLGGPAPIVDQQRCYIVGHSWNHNSRLEFFRDTREIRE